MNIHIVVEGQIGERYVYECWIPYTNPKLSKVPTVFDAKFDNFSIVAGGGFPNYFEVIEAAIEDVNEAGNVDKLVIAIDSENMSCDEKHEELTGFLTDKRCKAPIHIIVQHFCLETWALANKRVAPRSPKSPHLQEFKAVFNVLATDPELLPPYPKLKLNRAQFAERYLREMLHDKHKNLTYSKGNPKALLHPSYYREVRKRLETTGHIASFQSFIDAFEK